MAGESLNSVLEVIRCHSARLCASPRGGGGGGAAGANTTSGDAALQESLYHPPKFIMVRHLRSHYTLPEGGGGEGERHGGTQPNPT